MTGIYRKSQMASSGSYGGSGNPSLGEGSGVYNDNFSVTLYRGNGSASGLTVNTGIDLTNGGMVWIKDRFNNSSHVIYDTSRGVNNYIQPDNDELQRTSLPTFNGLSQFRTNGFTLGGFGQVNNSNSDYVAWSFKKAQKFFDIVTYTGNGATSRTLNHNLNCAVGRMVVKRLDSAGDWTVYDRHFSISSTNGQFYNFWNGRTGAELNGSNRWNSTMPTTTQFTVGNHVDVNASGGSYVAYLWAHDDTSPDSLIQVTRTNHSLHTNTFRENAFQTAGTPNGFEPGFLWYKSVRHNSSAGQTSDWVMVDTNRGWGRGVVKELHTNDNGGEYKRTGAYFYRNQKGFTSIGNLNGTGHVASFSMLAIRKNMQDMSTRSGNLSGTSGSTNVFYASTGQTSSYPTPAFVNSTLTSGGSTYAPHVDMAIAIDSPVNQTNWRIYTRDLGEGYLDIESNTQHNFAADTSKRWDHYYGWYETGVSAPNLPYGWLWKRAKGFFDVQPYRNKINMANNGNYADHEVPHELGSTDQAPMLWVKGVNNFRNWAVWHPSFQNPDREFLRLNSTAGVVTDTGNTYPFGSQPPTATHMYFGDWESVNEGASNNVYEYIAFIFGETSGVSKLGSYTGTGTSTVTVNCGFTNGIEFVMIKRADSSGNWTIFDRVRGINTSANDVRLTTQTTNAYSTIHDEIEQTTNGFKIFANISAGGNLNVNGGHYIFYAIART